MYRSASQAVIWGGCDRTSYPRRWRAHVLRVDGTLFGRRHQATRVPLAPRLVPP